MLKVVKVNVMRSINMAAAYQLLIVCRVMNAAQA